jgi:hypothetical protein
MEERFMNPRLLELAGKNLLGTITEAEAAELKLMAKEAKKEIRQNAKTDPEMIIARLEKKVEAILGQIEYVKENGKLPEKEIQLDENGNPIKGRRGRKPAEVAVDEDDE